MFEQKVCRIARTEYLSLFVSNDKRCFVTYAAYICKRVDSFQFVLTYYQEKEFH